MTDTPCRAAGWLGGTGAFVGSDCTAVSVIHVSAYLKDNKELLILADAQTKLTHSDGEQNEC